MAMEFELESFARRQDAVTKRILDTLAKLTDAVTGARVKEPPDPRATTTTKGCWHITPSLTQAPPDATPAALPRLRLEPPRFDGGNAPDWIAKIQRYYNHHYTPLDDRLDLIKYLFDHPASAWLEYWVETKKGKNWEDFLVAVQRRFAPELTEEISQLVDDNRFDALLSNEFEDCKFRHQIVSDCVVIEPEALELISTDSDAPDTFHEDREFFEVVPQLTTKANVPIVDASGPIIACADRLLNSSIVIEAHRDPVLEGKEGCFDIEKLRKQIHTSTFPSPHLMNLEVDEDNGKTVPEEKEHVYIQPSESHSSKGKKKDGGDSKQQDHYALLGLSNLRYLVTDDQIRKSYHEAALRHHPDKQAALLFLEKTEDAKQAQKDEIETSFKSIQESYEVLIDPVKRRIYDSTDEFDDEIPIDCAPQDFYKVYGPAFLRNGHRSVNQDVPSLGDDKSSIKEVDSFYDFWYAFKSWREFPHTDEFDIEQAESRDHERWMERQNAKLLKTRKEEYARIRTLVDNAYKRDPRILIRKDELKAEKVRKREAKVLTKKMQEEDAARIVEEEKENSDADCAVEIASSDISVWRGNETKLPTETDFIDPPYFCFDIFGTSRNKVWLLIAVEYGSSVQMELTMRCTYGPGADFCSAACDMVKLRSEEHYAWVHTFIFSASSIVECQFQFISENDWTNSKGRLKDYNGAAYLAYMFSFQPNSYGKDGGVGDGTVVEGPMFSPQLRLIPILMRDMFVVLCVRSQGFEHTELLLENCHLIPIDEHIIWSKATTFSYCSPKSDTKVSYIYRRSLMVTFELRCVGFFGATTALRDLVNPFISTKIGALFSEICGLFYLHEFSMLMISNNFPLANDGFRILDWTKGMGWKVLSLFSATEQSRRRLCSAASREQAISPLQHCPHLRLEDKAILLGGGVDRDSVSTTDLATNEQLDIEDVGQPGRAKRENAGAATGEDKLDATGEKAEILRTKKVRQKRRSPKSA